MAKSKTRIDEIEVNMFLNNLKQAIFDNETVTIGRGTFTPEELKNVKLALEERKDLITILQRITIGIREKYEHYME